MLIDVRFVGIIGGWLCAFFVEKRYTSRPAQLPVALDAFLLMGGLGVFEKSWEAWELCYYLKVYLCIGVILGVIGLLSYICKVSLPSELYSLGYWLYSSKTAMPLSTAFVFFSNYYPELLYEAEFWVMFVGLACLSWFPIFTIGAVVLLFAVSWLYHEYIT